ncbi:carboxyvinyl-carboxyphosphonate phosphorylmutase [Pseudooceanicola sediminis]|uniref:Carboxyvinyl-carboxyphosphonate phosphorylmutase n=1 Tax=Pseudooceanicola sediminis TaxID=2211117 RepID=A0A399IZL4_9RHOB|nr:isocitrate lyase/PEP mutase family protein [Pseudooceanicola sediminis]RII37887.1 carboxyvinyl-carboxyphosphonate phosphorylmutase [Pseudooceanicola sediminis]|tara:strand:- start:35593 stop:36456 length:864 start_codon:yes stop_codon:yes gene_type:complete
MANPALRQKLTSGDFILAPGVFDLISTLIADRAGFPALYVTGYGTVASHLGLPDAGLATYTEMLGRISQMVKRADTPIIADADTGYGGLLNVRHTVQGYEDAGVTAIQIEDQEFPKKCGHTPGRRVVAMQDMVRKVEVAVDSRRSDDFLIIARTDARTTLGLDEAIRRGKAYAAAGADIVFVESPESPEEMRRIADEIDRPLMANMVEGGRTPILTAEALADLGYALAIHPATGFLAVGAALTAAYADLLAHGETTEAIPMHSFSDFNTLVGFEDVWAFERRFPEID